MAKKPERRHDVSSPAILAELFTHDHLEWTVRRMYQTKDGEDLVSPPLRRVILLEYREHLAQMLSQLVPGGTWSPRAAYSVLVGKRTGSYRELVFPGIVDTIVGRRAIDALEPFITADDGETAFCGRSHANTTREPGDYERWFEVWQDFTAAIANAAQEAGYAYVFHTDVADFFPSIDRTKARQFLAQRTNAHPTLVELIFYCLEAWLPRFGYAPTSGLPIENNDISRLVAHNFVKVVDQAFVGNGAVQYLRFVDDTVVFVPTEQDAEEAKRRHHMALRQVGLAPNASKTGIVSVERYEGARHREINRQLDMARKTEDSAIVKEVAADWYSRDPSSTEEWDQVAKRLYSTARQLGVEVMREHAARDVSVPQLSDHALRYLLRFQVTAAEWGALKEILDRGDLTLEIRLKLATFLCDAVFADVVSEDLCDTSVRQITRRDQRHGAGYVKGLFLLVLHKHGQRDDRRKILRWASIDRLVDEMLRMHFLYVYYCCQELSEDLLASLRHLATSDIELTMRLCRDAKAGRLQHWKKILNSLCVRNFGAGRTIPARYLPLVRLMLRCEKHREGNLSWLERVLAANTGVADVIVRRLLEAEQTALLS